MTGRRLVVFLVVFVPAAAVIVAGAWLAIDRASTPC